MTVGDGGEALDVEYLHAGVAQCFTEEALGVWPEGGFYFGVVGILVDEGAFDAQFGQGGAVEVVGAAVDGLRADDVVAGSGDIDYGEE